MNGCTSLCLEESCADNHVASFVAQHVIASAQTAVQVEKILVDESKKVVGAQFGALQKVLNASMESTDPILSQIAKFMNTSLQTSVAQAQQLANMIMGGQA